MILTKDALQVAMCKKKVADAFLSRNGRFLALMDADGRYLWHLGSVTKSSRHASVGVASSGTDMAGIEIQFPFL